MESQRDSFQEKIIKIVLDDSLLRLDSVVKQKKNTQIDVEHGESEMCFILLCSEDIYEWTELGIIQRVSRSLSGIISHNVSASTEENRTSILGKR